MRVSGTVVILESSFGGEILLSLKELERFSAHGEFHNGDKRILHYNGNERMEQYYGSKFTLNVLIE